MSPRCKLHELNGLEAQQNSALFLLKHPIYSRRQIDSLMEEHGLNAESDGKDWDAYNAYLTSIDTVLQKKGLRYGKW